MTMSVIKHSSMQQMTLEQFCDSHGVVDRDRIASSKFFQQHSIFHATQFTVEEWKKKFDEEGFSYKIAHAISSNTDSGSSSLRKDLILKTIEELKKIAIKLGASSEELAELDSKPKLINFIKHREESDAK